MMNRLLFLLVLVAGITSCGADADQYKPRPDEAPGSWLVLYPDHSQLTSAQRELYTGQVQDSLISLMGLKLIRLDKNGSFYQADSVLGKHGKWMIDEDLEFRADHGGEGFEKFSGKFQTTLNDTMQIREMVSIDGKKIPITWFFKRLRGKDRLALLESERNQWRIKPTAPQPVDTIRMRVKEMLNYYGDYFNIVSIESTYFLPLRVPLPFKYYQHAVGLMLWEKEHRFNNYFFNEEDAKQAYGVLQEAIDASKSKSFPRGENFVVEYGQYLKQLATAIP